MKKQLKNFFIFFSVFASVALVAVLEVRYFQERSFFSENRAEDSLNDFLYSDKNFSGTIKKEYEELKKSVQEAKDIFSKRNENLGLQEARKLEENIVRRLDEKNLQKLDPVVKNISTAADSEKWETEITTVFPEKDKGFLARIEFQYREPCARCFGGQEDCSQEKRIQLFPKRIFDVFSAEEKGGIREFLEKWNANMPEGICDKSVFFENSRFIVVDSCEKDIVCDQSENEKLNASLMNYLKNI